ncbi:MAG TPA: metallophosphoesterase [Thermodesulfovibrionales bacterium]|jgi:putative phosphoesterase|nr:metallophosphoesterase [Thermodesulfovibrionales bacterium]
MILGIISDSHDDMASIAWAVDLFNARGASHVIHAGDIISPFTFEVFRELVCPFTGIFGNNDGDKLLLREKSGGTIHKQPYIMTLQGKKIVILHEPDLVAALGESGDFDIVIYGHTHRPDVRKMTNVLVVNPGKLARLNKGKATLALLDMDSMEAEIITLP